jgi:uncharacterized protein (DUF58 family)
VLAFSAIRNNDKVGLLLFSDHVELYIPPRKGRQHTLRLIREMLYFEPKGRGTQPAPALRYLNRVLTRKAVVFLISDFQAGNFLQELGVTAKRHDLVAIPVVDPCEEELPDAGMVTFEDAETGELIEVDTSNPTVRAAHAHLVGRQRTQLLRDLRRKRVDVISLATNQDYIPALRTFFATRERRLALQ